MSEYSVEGLRARFEAWVKDERGYTEWEIVGLRDGDNYLHGCDLYLAWKAWQKVNELTAEDEIAAEIFPGTKRSLDNLEFKHDRTGEDNG